MSVAVGPATVTVGDISSIAVPPPGPLFELVVLYNLSPTFLSINGGVEWLAPWTANVYALAVVGYPVRYEVAGASGATGQLLATFFMPDELPANAVYPLALPATEVTAMSPTSSVPIISSTLDSADWTINTTTYQGIYNDPTRAVFLPAVEGDTIEAFVGILWANEASEGRLNFATNVGGAFVNNFMANTTGVTSCVGLSGATYPVYGTAIRTLTAGDLTASTPTTVGVSLVGRLAAAGAKTVVGTGGRAIFYGFRNLGQ